MADKNTKANSAVNGLEGSTAHTKPLTCGIIMPISAIDGATAEHWAEVKSIITDAIEKISTPQFKANLVSDADEVGVIQKRIVQNVYSSDIIVCDVSGKNPNVMFELGMRLAFDKPTVIIKDDKTEYSFDTGVIEHISYPRDLRYPRVVEFKQKLVHKLQGTYRASQGEAKHSSFLKNFGEFHVASLPQKEVSTDTFLLEAVKDVQVQLTQLGRRIREIQSSSAAVRTNRTLEHLIVDAIANVGSKQLVLDAMKSGDLPDLIYMELRRRHVIASPDEIRETLDSPRLWSYIQELSTEPDLGGRN